VPRNPKKKLKAALQNKPVHQPKLTLTARDRAAGDWFARLVALQARLRGPKGCPWDREQTHESLRRYLIEEAYEVLDEIEGGDSQRFASELGDLLLQVIFHSILAEEMKNFTISDVIESVYAKMVRRHPHVFGHVTAKNSKAVLKNWERIKAEERAENDGAKVSLESILDDVPRSLPGLLEAHQLTRKAAKAGFDWDHLGGILDKLDEETRELLELTTSQVKRRDGENAGPMPTRVEEEVGDLLFAAVNVARFLGLDPEVTLKKANRKFKERFQSMEAAAKRRGVAFKDLSREDMEALWDQSKTTL
jgi:MazG family protein